MKTFYSNGKLLLTGEYAVLDGALALAIPTKYGQSLKVSETNTAKLVWKSYSDEGALWFEACYNSATLTEINSSNSDISKRLLEILSEAKSINPYFLTNLNGCEIVTHVDFPRNWGLGTSSTLINNIAQWAQIDAFQLLKKTFGGSGYDIACAQNNTPILYQLEQGKPTVLKTSFNKDFIQNLYFVYLNKKQNSRDEIERFNNQKTDKKALIEKLSSITNQIINCNDLLEFELLLNIHETLLATILNRTPVKKLLFKDFKGAIKSLGAWGGDFILVTGNEDTPNYFKKKGYTTVIPFNKMIL